MTPLSEPVGRQAITSNEVDVTFLSGKQVVPRTAIGDNSLCSHCSLIILSALTNSWSLELRTAEQVLEGWKKACRLCYIAKRALNSLYWLGHTPSSTVVGVKSTIKSTAVHFYLDPEKAGPRRTDGLPLSECAVSISHAEDRPSATLWQRSQAKKDLDTCITGHACKPCIDVPLPTRLLDVYDLQKIRLVIPAESGLSVGRYCALSYC
ncbi:hypothetical protein F5Y19DRAFT_82153 [Xylariaceae sp. FL1651]|nr:hypothetical protein F5Y19DRAFT_82153 [Xylariaceae sp. FL1651]